MTHVAMTFVKRRKESWPSREQKNGKSLEMKIYLLNQVENIVAKGEIAHYEPFVTLFSKVVCCRLVRKHLDVGKGK